MLLSSYSKNYRGSDSHDIMRKDFSSILSKLCTISHPLNDHPIDEFNNLDEKTRQCGIKLLLAEHIPLVLVYLSGTEYNNEFKSAYLSLTINQMKEQSFPDLEKITQEFSLSKNPL